LNSDCFQSYLNSFSEKYSKDLHFIQLDNGSFHYKKDLIIPDNIIFIFQPPYTPEVNPIERLWRYLKDQLQWYVFENLAPLRITLSKILNKLNNSIISSITCYPFIVDALCVANI
jgi:transposase